MGTVSVWVAVGVFAFFSGGQPGETVQTPNQTFKSKAECDTWKAEALERVRNDTDESVTLVAFGDGCFEVKVERQEPKKAVREFTPDEKSGKAKGSL